jgi:magnesium transporter
MLGLLLGALGFVRIAIWANAGFMGADGEHWVLLGLTIFASLIGVVMWGTLTGSLLPILMKRIGADPATSSTPFVATLVDVTGIVIYFAIATVVLHGTLL